MTGGGVGKGGVGLRSPSGNTEGGSGTTLGGTIHLTIPGMAFFMSIHHRVPQGEGMARIPTDGFLAVLYQPISPYHPPAPRTHTTPPPTLRPLLIVLAP